VRPWCTGAVIVTLELRDVIRSEAGAGAEVNLGSTCGQPVVNLGSTWGQPGVNLGST
jgi:hypothetical protein